MLVQWAWETGGGFFWRWEKQGGPEGLETSEYTNMLMYGS